MPVVVDVDMSASSSTMQVHEEKLQKNPERGQEKERKRRGYKIEKEKPLRSF